MDEEKRPFVNVALMYKELRGIDDVISPLLDKFHEIFIPPHPTLGPRSDSDRPHMTFSINEDMYSDKLVVAKLQDGLNAIRLLLGEVYGVVTNLKYVSEEVDDAYLKCHYEVFDENKQSGYEKPAFLYYDMRSRIPIKRTTTIVDNMLLDVLRVLRVCAPSVNIQELSAPNDSYLGRLKVLQKNKTESTSKVPTQFSRDRLNMMLTVAKRVQGIWKAENDKKKHHKSPGAAAKAANKSV